MKTIAFFIAILVLSLSACAQKQADSNHPSTISAKLETTLPWLQIKIWNYQSKPVSNPPRSIIKTTFESKPVYYVPAVCCDIPSELYAEDGKLICYPSGGITGNGDGKCTKFRFEYLDNKTNTKTNTEANTKDNKNTMVWEDKRKPAVGTKPERVVPNLQ
jgi:hypothetical protein